MADENDQNQQDNNLAQLRAKAERADELAAQLAERDRRDAFRDAGIDVSQGVGKLVYDSFQPGDEPVTAERVLGYAQQYGVAPLQGQAPPPAPTPAPTPAGIPAPQMTEAEQRFFNVSGAANGGQEPAPTEGPLGDRAFRAFETEQRAGVQRDKAAITGLRSIFDAAQRGDREALYDQREWRERNGFTAS